MNKEHIDYKLYLCTDRTLQKEKKLEEIVEQAVKGGCSVVQLREKECSTKEFIELARSVKKVTDRYGIPLIINDRIDIMMAVDADGVHLGQDDMMVRDARKLIGTKKIIGCSAHNLEEARRAYEEGADYLGVGAIYPTTTKVKTVLTSTDTLRDICNAVPIPANAIGGLNKDNIDVLAGIPIAGICVVSAIMKADDPRQAAIELKEKVQIMI